MKKYNSRIYEEFMNFVHSNSILIETIGAWAIRLSSIKTVLYSVLNIFQISIKLIWASTIVKTLVSAPKCSSASIDRGETKVIHRTFKMPAISLSIEGRLEPRRQVLPLPSGPSSNIVTRKSRRIQLQVIWIRPPHPALLANSSRFTTTLRTIAVTLISRGPTSKRTSAMRSSAKTGRT